ncbi:30S ribosomal protein S5 [endosymbiont of Euscepes postfasciatus]|uniref:30S ribosomal protein S5 n=1 Tax=endosymbiont of Euscepes postfasciatus TaxID=650377 RepID=UPI000DC70685|nr:30S ribosomal protein S5 [endosymbiont of Euscepes postfasciatus]BBA84676.1 30S ribosomal protein S5 [endosymbiont of Euscepes postfasciatus]
MEFIEKLISIKRVSKTVKGGRIFSFSSLTVVGNQNGKVGFGYGKSKEAPISIQKSINNAYKNIIDIYINSNKSIYYESYGKYIKSKVLIKPSKGTGIIAGNTVRLIFQLSGIKNIITKIYGSTNPINVVKATIIAIKKIKSIQYLSRKRNKNIKYLLINK